MAMIYVTFVLEIQIFKQLGAYGLGTLLAFVSLGFLRVHILANAKIEPLLLQHFTEFSSLNEPVSKSKG